MSRIVYLNGSYILEEEAKVSVFDRGFLFADGVYEGIAVLDSRLVDFDAHLRRLHRSLSAIEMKDACSDDEILDIHRQLIKKNKVTEGFVYMQVTRGVADRDFLYPDDNIPSTIFVFTQKKDLVNTSLAKRGAKIITVEDQRWNRRDLKTIQLLSQTMAKMEAHRKGVDDAWLIDGKWVNEGTASNAYIVTNDDVIVTRNLSNQILHGITRSAILQCAKDLQLKVEERAFSIDEAKNAKEAFLTGSASLICSVVEIDSQKIGIGKPDTIVKSLRETYIKLALDQAI